MLIGEVSGERCQSASPAFRMRSFGWGQTVLRQAYPNMQFRVAVPGVSGIDDIIACFAGELIDGAEFVYPQADKVDSTLVNVHAWLMATGQVAEHSELGGAL